MRLIRRASLALLALAAATLFLGGAARAEETSARLSLINPTLTIRGLKIYGIGASLDGEDFGQCNEARPNRNGVCVKPQPIAPGPHVLEINFDPARSTYFHAVVKFTAGVRGDVVVDLAKLGADAPESEYLLLHGTLAPAVGCIPAVDRVASLSSCTSDGLDAVAHAFLEAANACTKGSADHDALERALARALQTHFELDIRRCYEVAKLHGLPYAVAAPLGPDDPLPWPPGTIEKTSWRWARDVLAEDTPGHDPGDVFDVVLQALPRMAERLAMLEGVMSAYLEHDPRPVLAAAEAAPWSLDPDRTAGHRIVLVLNSPGFFYDAGFADHVAAAVAADPSLDCATTAWQARHLVAYFTDRDGLSRAQWEAVAAMMRRTPADGDFLPCAPAFDASRRSPVSVSERLHLLVALDCAPGRHPRGEWLKKILRKDSERMPLVDFDLRDQLRSEFAGCIERKEGK